MAQTPLVTAPSLGAAALLRDPLRLVLAAGIGTSAVLHGQMALAGAHGSGWSVLMGTMAAVCVFCAAGLLRRGDPVAAVRMSTGMALAMALLHVLALPLLSGSGGHARHGVASAAGGVAEAGRGTMLLVVVVELAVAAGAVAWIRRHGPCDGLRPAGRPAGGGVR